MEGRRFFFIFRNGICDDDNPNRGANCIGIQEKSEKLVKNIKWQLQKFIACERPPVDVLKPTLLSHATGSFGRRQRAGKAAFSKPLSETGRFFPLRRLRIREAKERRIGKKYSGTPAACLRNKNRRSNIRFLNMKKNSRFWPFTFSSVELASYKRAGYSNETRVLIFP